jgi:hypothetical protein
MDAAIRLLSKHISVLVTLLVNATSMEATSGERDGWSYIEEARDYIENNNLIKAVEMFKADVDLKMSIGGDE